MSDRTIPAPTEAEFAHALRGIITQARAAGVDPYVPETHSFILHQAEVFAQLRAENRWLNSLLHSK